MDDYNPNTLSEAKSEYSERLVSILTPPIIQGFKSIFDEANKLCIDNDEDNKYLMTFQNFLTRVPKWNQEIINLETKRIIETSKCSYLEDLLTCVHITQLKILTSIRVSSKQKKIELTIPKLFDFIHKVYIVAARKIYQNVYLFERDILPLQQQKHLRECELLIKESIFTIIRETMPIETILKAYIDETEEEEIIEENFVKEEEDVIKEDVIKEDVIKEDVEKDKNKTNVEDILPNVIKTEEFSQNNDQGLRPKLVINDKPVGLDKNITVDKPVDNPVESDKNIMFETNKENVNEIQVSPPPSISFNDTDNVVSFKKKDLPGEIHKSEPEKINAPKTIERLEQISTKRHEQRKLDELGDEDEDNDMERITIMENAPNVALGALDVQVLDNSIKLNTSPPLMGVEILE